MTENRFAQVKETFKPSPEKVRATHQKSTRNSKKAASNYNKKGRYPFSLHEDVRYDKLEELVEYHQAKSASDYLENLIIREWERMQRKLKK
ncbi:hypothetical protein PNU99_00235 [Streptococcus anginosus]|jgi:hypothetical protein|uniref:hypothetical protein n=1 Tax=Streptococcus anginosus TaxID=1328 RepID=UPI0018AC5951|nr:hypothetical protein [Streptococcus anginosus]MDB8664293.1 hypothetical protein [Streptococcus anginosus]